MSHDARQVREIQAAIRKVLLHRWDPIGVAGVPQAADEYDGYVGPVYRLLSSHATDRQLAEYLADIQANAMELDDPGWRSLLPVAHELQKLFAESNSTPPAT